MIDGDLFSVEEKTASYSIKGVVDLPSHPSQNTCDFLSLILSDFSGFIPSKELFENPTKICAMSTTGGFSYENIHLFR